MKILQVANVANLIGGTGACAHDVRWSLNTCEHAAAFVNSGIRDDPALAQRFGCPIVIDRAKLWPTVQQFAPDVILWHNTDPRMTAEACRALPDVRHAYYHHSGLGNVRILDDVVPVRLVVSGYLARALNLPESLVLPQPILPPRMLQWRRGERITIGRLCTPHPRKWQLEEQLPLYQALAAAHPHVTWEFVGCPAHARAQLAAVVPESRFLEPSIEARSRLHSWHAMLFHATQPETYGRVVTEAQHCGCVPIVDDQGGFREQIEHGKTGFLCGSVAAFVEAVGQIGSIDCSRLPEVAEKRNGADAWRAAFLKRIER